MSAQPIAVEQLAFSFPVDWAVTKYDDWSFYRNQFGRMRSGAKALDLLAMASSATAWLIEVKDYRRHLRTKPSCVSEEVAQKAFDTLAAMLPAAINASEPSERNFAGSMLKAKTLRIVLHLEQPTKASKLFPRPIDPSNIQQKLRQLVKPIDAHPLVVEKSRMNGLPWTVS